MIIAPSEEEIDDVDIRFPGEGDEENGVTPIRVEVDGSRPDKNRLVAYSLIGIGVIMMLNKLLHFLLQDIIKMIMNGNIKNQMSMVNGCLY